MPKKTERGAVATSQGNNSKHLRPTQEQIVLAHLKEHGSITSMTAFRLYSITRLSGRIYNLRHAGYCIPKVYEQSANGARYARYFLQGDAS